MQSDRAMDSLLQRARRAIPSAMSRDAGRLNGLWSRWRAQPLDAAARAAFEQALQASVDTCRARAERLPRALVQPELPIAGEAERIVELIGRHQVVVVAGETGSGKTTQLPKLCLAAGRGAAGTIGCTQPRRLAARAVARRVAEELQVPLGGAVGYQVRFSDRTDADTVVKFMTDGILLAETASDRWLSAYDTLIIDEAHERSLNIDFLLGYLKQLLARRPDLKLIVTSATIDTERFSRHFDDAPVVSVEGRGYPVEVRYRPLGEPGPESAFPRKQSQHGDGTGKVDSNPAPTVSPLDGIVAACDEIMREKGVGDTLIFLPGEREIRDAHRALEQRKYRHTEVLPLYARLSARDQDRVFNPGPQRRIVLATNVAETSLTVPRIHYVIDPGLARVKRYSPRLKLDRLHVEPISQASADQRKGRCGRIAPGICYRLYSEADFQSRPVYTDPEIRRSALAGVILRMLMLGLGGDGQAGRKRRGRRKPGSESTFPRKQSQTGDAEGTVESAAGFGRLIEEFPFLEPPDARAIADGWQQLTELGAVDAQRRLTRTGTQMAQLPVDVKLARMLVAAHRHGCLHELLIVAAFLGIQDPRERPPEQRAAADNAHAEFADPKSEFVGMLKLWAAHEAAREAGTQSQLRRWCERHFLGFLRMREWRELHRQLKLQCEALGWEQNPAPAAYPVIHRALIAGLPGQLGQRTEKAFYDGPRGRKFQLFPGSPLARKPPPWVLSATLLDTEKVWALGNAAIEPQWAIDELPHLLARRHHDPRWSRSQGRVIGSEQISLFGLVLAPKQPVDYGRLYPEEARGFFLRDGLVTGEINTRSAFVARNLRTLERALEEEAKQRRVGLVVDEDWMVEWYRQRIPADVLGAQALDAWYRKAPEAVRQALEWTRDDLLVGDESEHARFPPVLAVGDARLPVRYRFEPGAPDDGMTVSVPLNLLAALDPAQLSWMAPGFVEERVTALIRSLPKAVRRNVVPAPDFARAFVQAHLEPGSDSLPGALARFLRRLTGIEIGAGDFDESSLDPHLHINLRLLDSDGRSVLAETRDLRDLRARFADRATRAFAESAARHLAGEALTAFPDQPIPESVPGAGGVAAWPALIEDGDGVRLSVLAEQAEARGLHAAGVRRLLRAALQGAIRQAVKQLPVKPKISLLYAAIEATAPRGEGVRDGDRLRADIVEGAFDALAAEGLAAIRDPAAFAQRRDRVARDLFAEAMRRLDIAEEVLARVAEIRVRLESAPMGWARANLDDMRAHLAALVPPGFLADVPEAMLSDYPRYLKALAMRSERALRDPQRDQQRMLEIGPLIDAAQDLLVDGRLDAPGRDALRRDIEEVRVSVHAQELAGRDGLSAKKFTRRLAELAASR